MMENFLLDLPRSLYIFACYYTFFCALVGEIFCIRQICANENVIGVAVSKIV